MGVREDSMSPSQSSARSLDPANVSRNCQSLNSTSSHCACVLQLLGGWKREKTVVNFELTDDQIAQKQEQLMRAMTESNRKMAEEQRAHEDRVQERIRRMKEKRQRGVGESFETLERQQTTLQKRHRDEMERQADKMRREIERRARSKSVERGVSYAWSNVSVNSCTIVTKMFELKLYWVYGMAAAGHVGNIRI